MPNRLRRPDHPAPGGTNWPVGGACATQGELATRLGLAAMPAAAEASGGARHRLAELSGGAIHFSHVSTAAALDLIRAAKARGRG
jgi:dihydroorotase